MAKTYEEVEKEIISHLPKTYGGRQEFINELRQLQGDELSKIGQLNTVAIRYFPEPNEDWMLSIRLLAQNGEL